MAASQDDVVRQTREVILQTLCALAETYDLVGERGHSLAFDRAAEMLNRKWELHESIHIIRSTLRTGG